MFSGKAGMIIRKSEYAGTSTMENVLERLKSLNSVKEDAYRQEFCELMDMVR